MILNDIKYKVYINDVLLKMPRVYTDDSSLFPPKVEFPIIGTVIGSPDIKDGWYTPNPLGHLTTAEKVTIPKEDGHSIEFNTVIKFEKTDYVIPVFETSSGVSGPAIFITTDGDMWVKTRGYSYTWHHYTPFMTAGETYQLNFKLESNGRITFGYINVNNPTDTNIFNNSMNGSYFSFDDYVALGYNSWEGINQSWVSYDLTQTYLKVDDEMVWKPIEELK